MLLVGIVVGLLLVGPRSRLRSPYVWGGGLIALLVSMPNVIYQATLTGWSPPQLAMGRSPLSEHNGDEVRWFMWVLFLVIVLGPPPRLGVGGEGWSSCGGASPEWRPVQFLVLRPSCFPRVLIFTFASAAASALPDVLSCSSCCSPPGSRPRPLPVGVALAFGPSTHSCRSGDLAAVVASVGSRQHAVCPAITPARRPTSVGWPAYVDQVEDGLRPTVPRSPDRPHTVS